MVFVRIKPIEIVNPLFKRLGTVVVNADVVGEFCHQMIDVSDNTRPVMVKFWCLLPVWLVIICAPDVFVTLNEIVLLTPDDPPVVLVPQIVIKILSPFLNAPAGIVTVVNCVSVITPPETIDAMGAV